MALLSEAKRKQYFEDLGLGNYNKTNIKRFQKTAFSNNSNEWDGVFGTKTDNALRHWWNVRKYTKNFKPEEFKCGCGGRYCTGYPTYMRPAALQHIQKIRDMYGKPITVTCGLRCKTYNKKLNGSIANSLHLSGLAIDFYQKGVTDTLANRKASIKKIKKLANHHYTYGNGINSNGASVKASYMGNCLHTDVTQPKTTTTTTTTTTTPTTTTTTTEQTWSEKAVAWAKKIAKDDTYHYVKWVQKDSKTHECPICKNHAKGKYHGFNCIGFAYSCLYHGAGIKIKHNNGVINNQKAEKILNASSGTAANKIVREALNNNNFKVIRNGKKVVPQSKMKAGDIGLYFKGNTYQHTFFYIGNGKMIDCTSSGDDANNIKQRTACSAKVVIRYTGK